MRPVISATFLAPPLPHRRDGQIRMSELALLGLLRCWVEVWGSPPPSRPHPSPTHCIKPQNYCVRGPGYVCWGAAGVRVRGAVSGLQFGSGLGPNRLAHTVGQGCWFRVRATHSSSMSVSRGNCGRLRLMTCDECGKGTQTHEDVSVRRQTGEARPFPFLHRHVTVRSGKDPCPFFTTTSLTPA